jgi:hypothetical protein
MDSLLEELPINIITTLNNKSSLSLFLTCNSFNDKLEKIMLEKKNLHLIVVTIKAFYLKQHLSSKTK